MTKTIKVYEQAADLSQVILGIEADVSRAQFDAICNVLIEKGYTVERYNPIHNAEVCKEVSILPTILIDTVKLIEGAYPTVDDIAEALNIEKEAFASVNRTNILKEANTTRLGSCCGVGQDVYFDPNEDDIWK